MHKLSFIDARVVTGHVSQRVSRHARVHVTWVASGLRDTEESSRTCAHGGGASWRAADPPLHLRRYFTDLIIALLQDHLAAAALLPAAEGAAPEPGLPEPMLPGELSQTAPRWRVFVLPESLLRSVQIPCTALAHAVRHQRMIGQTHTNGQSR